LRHFKLRIETGDKHVDRLRSHRLYHRGNVPRLGHPRRVKAIGSRFRVRNQAIEHRFHRVGMID